MKLSDIRKIGIVGAGNMGHGIALSFALWGYPTVMTDIDAGSLKNALERIRSALDTFIEEEVVTAKQAAAALEMITTTPDLAVLARDVDYVCEAIRETSRDKKDLFNALDAMCPPHTILASNTSSLVLSDFGSDVSRQDKIVVTHYFYPPYIVPCVEVVRGPGTSEETFNLTYDLLEKVKKLPVRLNRELPGYLVNRIQSAMMREVFALWAEGVASAADIDRAVSGSFGFRLAELGPLLSSDISGMPKQGRVIVDMFNRLFHEISDAKEIPRELSERWESHQGFYDYSREEWEQITSRKGRELLRRLKHFYGSPGKD